MLQDISHYTPLGAAVQAMQASMNVGFPPATPLLVLVAYALVFGFVAKRFFRWSSREEISAKFYNVFTVALRYANLYHG